MSADAKKATDEAQIRALIEDWANALYTKDARRMVYHYAANNVMFLMAPPLQYTAENSPGRQGVEEWVATWDGRIGYEVHGLKIAVGGAVAFSHSLDHMSGVKTDGEKVDMWLRQTLCFCMLDGQWQITHQHESVPFYMDGGYKAAVDLKP